MSTAVHPEILDGLETEQQFIQQTSGSQRRVVKLNRGDSWLLRFLPAQLGPNKRWYARVAKHWVNQRAIICPRQTEEAYGGDPNAYCAVCELSEHLNNERNEDVSKFGFKLRATPNWVTWCAVFAKASNGGAEQNMPLPEVLLPYEFPHYKTSWEELTGFVKQGVRRTPNSVLDLEKGNDFYVSKTAKGLRLDKQDAGPIFDLNDLDAFDANVAKLLAACKDPVVKIPDEKAMDTFAKKAEEEADNIGRGGGNRAGGRAGRGGRQEQGADEDDLPPEDAPPARGARTAPQQEAPPARAPRTAAPPAAAAPPARRTAAPPPPAPAPAPRRAAAPPPPVDPEPPVDDQGQGDPGDLPPEDQGGEAPFDEQQQEPAPPPAPQLRRAPAPVAAAPAVPRPSSRSATGQRPVTAAPAAPVRSQAPASAAAPSRAAAPTRTGGGAPAQESIDEHEHIPEEARDQAPPAPLVDPADDTGGQPADDGGEAPPNVQAARRGFANNVRGKIAAANNSAKQ